MCCGDPARANCKGVEEEGLACTAQKYSGLEFGRNWEGGGVSGRLSEALDVLIWNVFGFYLVADRLLIELL